MSRALTVIRREYLERVRSRAFLVSTILGPLFLVAIMIGPMVVARQGGKPLRVSIVDATGKLAPAIESALANARGPRGDTPLFSIVPVRASSTGEEAKRAARAAVGEGRLDAFLYLAPDALRTSQAEYYGKNVSNMMDIQMLQKASDDALLERRLSQEGVEGSRAQLLMRKLDLKRIQVTATGEREDRGASFLLALMLFTLLYSTVLMWGAAIMNGVIEEKTNRVVEVIVSSMPTSALFTGKLIGVGAAGLTQFLVWALTLGAFGLYGAAAARMGGVPLPELSPLLLVSFVVYFLLGYFLYGALYAAVGSAVNTQQEAQSLAFPIMMPLVLGFVFFPAVLSSPDSPLAVVLSLIPLFTPMLMFLRISVLTPPVWQIALSLALTLGAVVAATWFASRVYRVGILMYGKRPTFPEIVRWARTS